MNYLSNIIFHVLCVSLVHKERSHCFFALRDIFKVQLRIFLFVLQLDEVCLEPVPRRNRVLERLDVIDFALAPVQHVAEGVLLRLHYLVYHALVVSCCLLVIILSHVHLLVLLQHQQQHPVMDE